MSKNNGKVSREPGSPNIDAAGMRILVEQDLKCAAVLAKLCGTSEKIARVLAQELAPDKPVTPERLKSLQTDAGLSSALIATIYQTPMIMDHVVEVMVGLSENIINKDKAKKQAAADLVAHGIADMMKNGK